MEIQEAIKNKSAKEVSDAINSMSADEIALLNYDWEEVWARKKQLLPKGDWFVWLLLAGRGFGKTRTGAETMRLWKDQVPIIHLVGETAADARDVMIEGEALALDTPIPIPNGWINLGELKIGDNVFARDGTITKIIALSPVWHGRECYSLLPDCSNAIIADKNHSWIVSNRAERRNDRLSRGENLRKTEEIFNTLMRRDDICEYEILMHNSLDLPDIKLPIPSYTLGAWLGDGDTRGHGTFSCHIKDVEIIENIKLDGFNVNKRSGIYEWGILKIGRLLNNEGLQGNKKIPNKYLRASHKQRLALVQGLMDTDGYVSSRGQCSFDNTLLHLVEDVRELLLTLGIKSGMIQVKPDKRGFKTMYRLTFTLSGNQPIPFRLRRKAEKCKKSIRSRGRLIRHVKSCKSVPVRCIQVAHKSGTFLAGLDMIVTHNSGILAISPPHDRPLYEPSKRRVTWKNGAIANVFSAEDPDQLRGPHCYKAWADELAKWRYPDAWDQLVLGAQLGENPQIVVTTTPRPTDIIKNLIEQEDTHLTTGTTFENKANLSGKFIDNIVKRYEGTRLGKQELLAEILTDIEGALWKMRLIEDNRVKKAPVMKRIVVAIDPAVSSKKSSNETGIVVAGLGVDDKGYVLSDVSGIYTPNGWAKKAINAYYDFEGDKIIGEVNNGGDMIENTLRSLDISVPYKSVWATRGKLTRAEPVHALYEQGKIKHVGIHEGLETQMTTWDASAGDKSPDRVDALVWAFTELMIKNINTNVWI